ncbi:MAG: DUF6471 domain-containing protein [Pedobacter agri]
MNQVDWNSCAKRMLKAELVRKGISPDDLASLLKGIGLSETKASIESKISRGTFSAAFLLQCFHAIGCVQMSTDINTLFIQTPENDIRK